MPDTTQIGEQMQTLGFALGADMRLKTIAWDVAKHGGDATDLLHALQDDPEAALAMFTPSELFHRAKTVLDQALTEQQRHARKRGVPIEFPRKRDGGGQTDCDTQKSGAPAEKQDSAGNGAASGDGGHKSGGSQGFAAATPDDDGQDAADPGGDRGGHGPDDTQRRTAPTVTNAPPRRTGDESRKASRPKRTGAGTDISKSLAEAALDLIRINGKPLRYAKPEYALQQAESWHINARVVEAICTGLAPGTPVGEQISDGEANALADRATKTAA